MNRLVERIKIPVFESQISNATSAMRKGQLARGPHLHELEKHLQLMFRRQFAVLTMNGFSALFAALKACISVPANVVTTPASTCFSMVNAIKSAGHTPVFVDMDIDSMSISEIALKATTKDDTIALIPDHFGLVAPYCRKSRSQRLYLIEDSAQAFLSRQKIQTDAEALVFSFYPTKLLNGIDGGAILTDDVDLFKRLQAFVSYAEQIEPEDTPRLNLGMANINAAFALGTLDHIGELRDVLLKGFTELREVAERIGLRVVSIQEGEIPTRFIVLCDGQSQRDSLVTSLRSRGIGASLELMWVCPLSERHRFPNSEKLVNTTFSLPLHPLTQPEDIQSIEAALGGA